MTFLEKTSKNLECLGYFPAIGGGKMWVYKTIVDGLEYEFVDLLTDDFQTCRWTEKNEFETVTFQEHRLSEIKEACNKLEKVENIIQFGDRDSYFTQHEIKEPDPPKIVKIENNTFTDDQATELLEFLDDYYDVLGHTSDGETTDWFEITEEKRQEAIDDRHIDLLENLVGYKFKVEQDGDHRHDGQMVDYGFTFKSPDGVETISWTEMCLMVSWNVCDEWVIK